MPEGPQLDPIAEAQRQWSAHWGDDALPAMGAVTSIMRTQQLLMARLNAILKPHGVTFPRYEALMILYFSRRGAMPLGKIGRRLQVHPTSVTSLIDGLERSGLVRRIPDATDRRATLAEITEDGRTTAERATTELNSSLFCTQPLQRPALERISALLRPFRADADGFAARASE